jgi:RNA polymerase sigma factor (sigma-70 family)
MENCSKIEEAYIDLREDLVRRYKSRAGTNDVEDLVQEGFYRALFYVDTFNPTLVPIEHWLAGIIDNCLKDLLREKRDGSAMHDKLDEDSAVIEPRYEDDLTKILTREIERKEGDLKSILYLYFLCGYELKEIHRVVGGSYHTLEVRTRRFKQLLRDLYPEYRDEIRED